MKKKVSSFVGWLMDKLSSISLFTSLCVLFVCLFLTAWAGGRGIFGLCILSAFCVLMYELYLSTRVFWHYYNGIGELDTMLVASFVSFFVGIGFGFIVWILGLFANFYPWMTEIMNYVTWGYSVVSLLIFIICLMIVIIKDVWDKRTERFDWLMVFIATVILFFAILISRTADIFSMPEIGSAGFFGILLLPSIIFVISWGIIKLIGPKEKKKEIRYI